MNKYNMNKTLECGFYFKKCGFYFIWNFKWTKQWFVSSCIDLTTFFIKEQEFMFFILSLVCVSSSGTVSARKTVSNDTALSVDKSECLQWEVYLSQWELSAWPCSVTTLSSNSSSMRKGCRETGSSWGHEYLCRYEWDKAASAVSRSMGLKVRIHSKKSMPEM